MLAVCPSLLCVPAHKSAVWNRDVGIGMRDGVDTGLERRGGGERPKSLRACAGH